jgi:predicted DNA binding CopG/RHH family protein
MKRQKFDPFKNLVLDKAEQKIEDAIERGEYIPDDSVGIDKMLSEAAKNYTELEESKSVTVRVKKKDLLKLKAKASRNDIPYQTLINLLIRSYNEGKTKLSL